MDFQAPNVNGHYQNLLLIWSLMLASHFLMFWSVYLLVDGVFPLDLSKPVFGDNPIFITLAALFAIHSLGLSFYRRSKLLKHSVTTQNIKFVMDALIVSLASASSSSVVGLVLAYTLQYTYFFIWIIAGAAVTIVLFPRRRHLIEAIAGPGQNPQL